MKSRIQIKFLVTRNLKLQNISISNNLQFLNSKTCTTPNQFTSSRNSGIVKAEKKTSGRLVEYQERTKQTGRIKKTEKKTSGTLNIRKKPTCHKIKCSHERRFRSLFAC
eukprot:Pompholyxophrys_punicea_v1_NODE_327_length_2248_cov_10.512762.p2 type:complete len:109 gc:universal NODE_327_length_2248_cov_10.512762:167-493(+)